MAGMIDIGTVLSKLNDTYDERTMNVKSYGLRFLANPDRGRDVTREVVCRKNVKAPKQKHDLREGGKTDHSLKKYGLVRVIPQGSEHPIDIKACMIYGFRDFNSTTWLNVFH